MEIMASWGFQPSSMALLLSWRSPGTHFESCRTPFCTSWVLEFCVWGQHDMRREGEEGWTCTGCVFPLLTHMLHEPIQLSLQNKFRDQIMKNFETIVVQPFTRLGALERPQVTAMKLALDSLISLFAFQDFYLFFWEISDIQYHTGFSYTTQWFNLLTLWNDHHS